MRFFFFFFINDCILSVGHVHKKMKMMEHNQQGTESRTALVEDRMNVVEDSVHQLQGDLSVYLFIYLQKGLSRHVLWLVWQGFLFYDLS